MQRARAEVGMGHFRGTGIRLHERETEAGWPLGCDGRGGVHARAEGKPDRSAENPRAEIRSPHIHKGNETAEAAWLEHRATWGREGAGGS